MGNGREEECRGCGSGLVRLMALSLIELRYSFSDGAGFGVHIVSGYITHGWLEVSRVEAIQALFAKPLIQKVHPFVHS